LYGMARHQSLAWVTLMESVANLILSIVLIGPFGIVGDAAGTAIPLLCTTLFFMPRHLCRVLGISVRSFVFEAYKLPLLLLTPFVVALVVLKRWFIPHTYLQVGLQIALALIPYGAGVAWAFWSNRVWHVDQSMVQNTPDEVSVALIESYQEEP
jgi:O-antigen/teichoic acid export membrane protein